MEFEGVWININIYHILISYIIVVSSNYSIVLHETLDEDGASYPCTHNGKYNSII